MSIFFNFDDTDDDLSNNSSSGNGPVLTWRNGEVVWEVKEKTSSEASDSSQHEKKKKFHGVLGADNQLYVCEVEGEEEPEFYVQPSPIPTWGDSSSGTVLKLTSEDQFCVFKDGYGDEWEILDFFTHKDYEVHARLRSCDSCFEDFNQFGKRKGYKLGSPCSLKSKQGDNT